MIIKPRVRGFMCVTTHPTGCAANVKQQIDYVKNHGPIADGPKRVLVIGASTGYGLASRITAAFGCGAATLGNARQIAAGSPAAQVVVDWQPLSEPPADEISSARPVRSGAFQQGDLLLALNRPVAEDNAALLTDTAVETIFAGLDYTRVEDRVDNSSALASEIWRAFLMAAAFALLAEALLCMPDRKRPQVEPAFA